MVTTRSPPRSRLLLPFLMLIWNCTHGFVHTTAGLSWMSPSSQRFASTLESIEEVEMSWSSDGFSATNCWGTQPLLMRKAFLESCIIQQELNIVSWDDVIQLACPPEDDAEAQDSLACRLIRHKPNTLDTYTVEFGPFSDANDLKHILLSNDEDQASTLVVNDVDRWIPSLSDWMDEQFDFLPRWRRDDAQISLAATNGSIGPHVDNYDVFLIQLSGSRTWEVALDTISVETEFDSLVPESQVRILDLDHPLPTQTFHLEPGDCLYLPARFMHCGKATSDDCATLSVGCRAPSAADLLSKVATFATESALESATKRYTDVDLMEAPNKSLSSTVKNQMKDIVMSLVKDILDDDKIWDSIIGESVTDPKRPTFDYPIPFEYMDEEWRNELGVWGNSKKAIQATLNGEGCLRRAEGVSFAWSVTKDGKEGNLFVQGRKFPLIVGDAAAADLPDGVMEGLLDRIANGPPLDQVFLSQLLGEATIPQGLDVFLQTLLNESILYGEDK